MSDEEPDTPQRPDPPTVPGERPVTSRGAYLADALEQRFMGARREYNRQEISRLGGVPEHVPRRVWRALGFADARDDERVFSAVDLAALRRAQALVDDGVLDGPTLRAMARAFGRSTDRLAMWQMQIIADMLSQEDAHALDADLAERVGQRMTELADELEPLLVYTWRRNLSQAAARMIADGEPESHLGVVRTVAFADLVSFTSLVRRLNERDLARLVVHFEETASDLVSQHGGAVIKTVGDEILFTHQSVDGAVTLALELLERAEADELIPRMRVGMATGRVLARLGDVYGTTVNRAARLTGQARPGSLLVDVDVAAVVRDRDDVEATELESLDLQGLGATNAWRLRRPGPQEDHR